MDEIIKLIGILAQQNGPLSLILTVIFTVFFIYKMIKQFFGSGKSVLLDLAIMKAQMCEVDLVFQEIISRCMEYYNERARKIVRNDLLAPLVDYAYERHLEYAVMIIGRSILRTFCRENGWDKLGTAEFALLKADRKKAVVAQVLKHMKDRFLPGAHPSYEELENDNDDLMFWVDNRLDKLIDRCREIGQNMRKKK